MGGGADHLPRLSASLHGASLPHSEKGPNKASCPPEALLPSALRSCRACTHGASLLELPWCIRALSQLMQGRTCVARSAIGQRGERKCARRSEPYGRQRTVCMKTGEHAYSNTNRQSCSVPCNRVRKGSRREVSLQEALHCRSRLHHFCAPRLQRRGINSKVKSMDGSGVPCAPTTFLLLQLCEEGVTIL